MPETEFKTDFLQPPQRDGELGRLGPYRVTDLLGLGGMGQVFRAEDTRLKRTVALKVMNQKFAATPHSRKRFIEEARSMAAVHHDNVATIFEVGQHKKTPFMAMELLRGQTIEQLVAEGRRFDFQEIIEIGKQTALGLDAAHCRGIVHRDIKPANLWMQTPQERIKILDFGLALAGTGVDRLSVVGSVIGTLGYLSPEQACNEPVDERTDLYALGVVLYELCCGKLPILGGNVSTQLVLILSQPPTPIREYNASVPEPLADLIEQLLSKEPGHRISTALRLHERLIEVAEEIVEDRKRQLDIVVPEGKTTPSKRRSTPPAPKAVATTAANRVANTVAVNSPDANAGEATENEADPASSTRRKSRQKSGGLAKLWPFVAGALLLVIVGIYFATQPRRIAQQPIDQSIPTGNTPARSDAAGNRTTRSSAATGNRPITAAILAPLKFDKSSIPSITTKVGEYATFDLVLNNEATLQSNDPRYLLRSAKDVARVVAYRRPLSDAAEETSDDQTGKDQEPQGEKWGLPKPFDPGQLPTSSLPRMFAMQLSTVGVPAGKYEVRFELRAPDETVLDWLTATLTVQAAGGAQKKAEAAKTDKPK